jgi:hypothetical protein
MPHVINSNERNQAFIKFLAFFLLTVFLIVCAVYVDFRGLPQKRQALLEQEFANQRTEVQVQQQFVQQMESAKLLLDSLDKGGKNRIQVEAALDGKLRDMENLKLRDSSLHGKLDAAILDSFLELQQLKKELERLRELPSKVLDLQQRLAETENSLDTYRSRPQTIPDNKAN